VGVKLSDEQWEHAESICSEYVQWSRHKQNHPDAKDVNKLISDINKGAKKLLSAINALTQNDGAARSQAQQVASSHISGKLVHFQSVSELKGPLNDVAIASKQALDNINEMVGPRTPGPKTVNAYGYIFMAAGKLFKEATGRKPVAYFDPYKETSVTPFVEFVYGLIESGPKEFRTTSKESLADQIKKHGKKVKENRGKSVDELLGLPPFTGDS
jgi:hypothetical protein